MANPTKPTTRKKAKWETIFDAKRDNGGKGVPIDEFLKTLEKIRSEEQDAHQ